MSAPHYAIVVLPQEKAELPREEGKAWFERVIRSLGKFERAPNPLRIAGVKVTAKPGDVVLLLVAMKAARIDDAQRVGWESSGSAPEDVASVFGTEVCAIAYRVRAAPFTFPAQLVVHEDATS